VKVEEGRISRRSGWLDPAATLAGRGGKTVKKGDELKAPTTTDWEGFSARNFVAKALRTSTLILVLPVVTFDK
jgi:hypothetical protein